MDMNQVIKEYFNKSKEELKLAAARYGAPHLVIIDPSDPDDIANKLYARNKVLDFMDMEWPVDVITVNNQEEYEAAIHDLERSEATAAIIQSPARQGIKIDFNDIPREMDCDGLGYSPLVLPATVRGVMDYLDACEFEYAGQHAVVLGRSKVVGLPMAKALMDRNMTVSVCHSKTPQYLRNRLIANAPLIICATGKPHLINRRQVAPYAVVIDVGISKKDGKIVGDFLENEEFCSDGWSTPVPGGVGLLTRIGLMKNCMDLRRARYETLPTESSVV